MGKRRVLILQEELQDYRVPIFNLLGERVELTLGFLKPLKIESKVRFSTHVFSPFRFQRFFYVKGLRSFCKDYDVAIYPAHLKVLNYFLLPFNKDKFKKIAWTNGTRASYTQVFDLNRKMKFLDHLYLMNLKKADAVLLYIEEAKETLKKHGVDLSKVFVAHNTVYVNYSKNNVEEKNSILFVGTLYKGKGVDELIDCYAEAHKGRRESEIPVLEIVGKGEELEGLKSKVNALQLTDKVLFRGAIYDEEVLAESFSRAMVCVSPNQAGLSVLKSFGYGVPFVTKKDAITGGEIVNVKDKYNGVLYEKKEELVLLFQDLVENKEHYLEMGKNAKEYYDTKASPENMVAGFLNAINYVLNQ
ncbi:MAG: glycosyltransferase family 4 protein [Chitinophagaceae bacterium]|nr:glycosyltransferase family 4 protein [Chitinophagaceae bacterium]